MLAEAASEGPFASATLTERVLGPAVQRLASSVSRTWLAPAGALAAAERESGRVGHGPGEGDRLCGGAGHFDVQRHGRRPCAHGLAGVDGHAGDGDRRRGGQGVADGEAHAGEEGQLAIGRHLSGHGSQGQDGAVGPLLDVGIEGAGRIVLRQQVRRRCRGRLDGARVGAVHVQLCGLQPGRSIGLRDPRRDVLGHPDVAGVGRQGETPDHLGEQGQIGAFGVGRTAVGRPDQQRAGGVGVNAEVRRADLDGEAAVKLPTRPTSARGSRRRPS